MMSTADVKGEILNSHASSFRLPPEKKQELTLYWNISVGKNTKESEKKALKALSKASGAGFEAVFASHKREWANFWNRSYINIADDHIENLYYLSLFYSNSECRGKYPPLFTNGIWGFRHDFVPWNYYFHYNMQHMYAPLEPSGHGELANSYYNMRAKGLKAAKKYTEKHSGKKGIFINDVTDRFGRGVFGETHNCTPASQIAMAMYKHYRMSGDEKFLKEKALPIMKGAAEFYLGMFKKEEDGLYHIHGTSAYEGNPDTHDTLTDIVMVKALFSALIKLEDDIITPEEKEAYRDVLINLPDYVLTAMDEEEKSGDTLAFGIGKGQKIRGEGLVFTIGKDDSSAYVRKNNGDPKKDTYGFPDIEMSPLYPAGVFGLKDKGTKLFEAMENQLLLHHDPENCMQWCMMPIYLARMGMAKELSEYNRKTAGYWLMYPNGLGVDGPGMIGEVRDRLKYNKTRNTETGETVESEAYGFRHFDMETLPIVAFSVAESLLQSYDGILRIFPATEPESDAAFTLFAEGGFKVSAEYSKNSFKVSIKSLRGEVALLKLPDFTAENELGFYRETDKGEREKFEPIYETNGREQVINLSPVLKKGDTVYITDNRPAEKALYKKQEKNKRYKTCLNTRLGTPPLLGKK